jgi:O-antigen ligase
MNARLAVVFVGLLFVCAGLGVVVASEPLRVGLPGILLLLAVIPGLLLLQRMTLLGFGVGGLVILHGLTVIRYSWIEALQFMRLVRVPLAVLVIGVLVVTVGRRLLRGPPRAALVPALVYTAWCLVGGAFALDPARAWFYGVWLLTNVITIALRPSPMDLWEDLLRAVLVLGIVLVGLSLLLAVLGVESAFHHRYLGGTAVRGIQGFFNNPNTMGRQACITVAAAMCLIDRRPDKSIPRWFLPLLIPCAIAALGSTSRGALLAFASGLLVFFQFRLRDQGKRVRPGQVALVLLVLLGFGLLANRTEVGQTGLSRLSDTGENVSTGEEGRVVIWKSYLDGYRRHPFTGVGFANLALADDPIALRTTDAPRSAHSALIEYAGTTGIPGTLLFLWLASCAWRGMRSAQGRAFGRSFVLFMAGMWPLYMFQTAGGNPGSGESWPLWVGVMCGAGFMGMQTTPVRALAPRLRLAEPAEAAP